MVADRAREFLPYNPFNQRSLKMKTWSDITGEILKNGCYEGRYAARSTRDGLARKALAKGYSVERWSLSAKEAHAGTMGTIGHHIRIY